MRTSYVSKNAEEREAKRKKVEERKRQQEVVKGNLSEVYTDLKSKSDANNVVPVKRKKSKKWLIPVIIILIIGIGCGAFFLSQSKNGVSSQESESSESTEVQEDLEDNL